MQFVICRLTKPDSFYSVCSFIFVLLLLVFFLFIARFLLHCVQSYCSWFLEFIIFFSHYRLAFSRVISHLALSLTTSIAVSICIPFSPRYFELCCYAAMINDCSHYFSFLRRQMFERERKSVLPFKCILHLASCFYDCTALFCSRVLLCPIRS